MNSNQYSEKTEKEINDYIQTKYELKLEKMHATSHIMHSSLG